MRELPKPLILALGVAMWAGVATADEFGSQHASLSMFYVLPIALVTWYVGGVWGLVLAVAGAATSFTFSVRGLPAGSGSLLLGWILFTRVVSFGAVALLLWSLSRALENQRSLANTDDSTGIGNGRNFRLAVNRELARARRDGQPLTAVYLDLDNFKQVNDRYGHTKGDELLRVVASTLLHNVRETDTVARLGGDEFAVLLPALAPADAPRTVDKLRRLLNEAMARRRWPVTCSMGAATFDPVPETADELIARVDALQYRAKTSGKDKLEYGIVSGAPAPAPTAGAIVPATETTHITPTPPLPALTAGAVGPVPSTEAVINADRAAA